MAKIRYMQWGPDRDPAEREVPDSASPTDHGIEWLDDKGAKHIVPWSVILEFTGPPPGSEETPSVERL
jgi:hypothetical protein